MATRRVEIGATGETVRRNIARIRNEQRLTLRQLADRLHETDRPLSYTTLSQIENGARRVDVDDLMTLAVALDVSPSALLAGADESDQPTSATGLPSISNRELWLFLEGYWSPRGSGIDFVLRSRPGMLPRLSRSVSASARDLAIERRVLVDEDASVLESNRIGNADFMRDEWENDGND
ncbi:helix-turn-helix domain-containing protein [Gordonia sputi]|uniref:helix-turn-helix domain-containing protein n=1 Tax=Gordonia sputi TaxID=36823 RepID=UPI0020433211|nr:helix-turn-helix transcriptional regulator [Gordonia sputi]MCM3894304.1 helix-turn-helix domain-containing protein [Gordonia sputi]